MSEQEFPKWIYFNLPRDNAPDFVIGSIALNVRNIDMDDLFSRMNEKWYVYLDVKRGKDGKPYVSFNTYKHTEKKEDTKSKYVKEDITIDDIPF